MLSALSTFNIGLQAADRIIPLKKKNVRPSESPAENTPVTSHLSEMKNPVFIWVGRPCMIWLSTAYLSFSLLTHSFA